ncbi:MAG TPA: deoxyribonuclease IV [Solirubrobacteraceae bacterium]|jgi:deoxyribonuclease-4|nr:deoxyribonuclease IV [Solirubrobacteraceae bacterium]
MLIGAHVSPAGGLPKAIERGLERDCHAIQIFNQSPRMWRPTVFPDEAIAAFREAMQDSQIDAVLIHAVYLLNCASEDEDIRAKTLTSLIQSLRVGQAIGASAVVLHPGSAKTGDPVEAVKRAGATIAEALAESEQCPLHLENTAGAGGTLGRSIDELAALLEAAGGDERLGLCLDSCHLFASGFDVRTPVGMDAVTEEIDAKLGLGRVGSLHLNDSQTALGSNRDRHADVGAGELGEEGCAAFLSAPALQGLPCVLETPGENHSGPGREQVRFARELHDRAVSERDGTRGKRTGKRRT